MIINRIYLVLSGIFGATAVILSAIVAHLFSPDQLSEGDRASVLSALQMMLMHSIAILAVSLCIALKTQEKLSRLWELPPLLWSLGIIFFAGGILAHRLLNLPTSFLAPWGGSSLILGWISVCLCGIFSLPLRK